MAKKQNTSTIRAGLDESHKFDALRRYYERKNYEETGEARRMSHAEVLRLLLSEPHVRALWESGGNLSRL